MIYIDFKKFASFLGIDVDFFNDIWDQHKFT